MSKIPYIEGITLARNIHRVREHTGMTNAQIGAQIGISGSVFGMYASCGFKTNAGNETGMTQRCKAHAESFFTGGIPDTAYVAKKVDLYALMGCESCTYRSKYRPGCIKFSLSREDINKGAFIHTLKHGAFTLSSNKTCPHAKVSA